MFFNTPFESYRIEGLKNWCFVILKDQKMLLLINRRYTWRHAPRVLKLAPRFSYVLKTLKFEIFLRKSRKSLNFIPIFSQKKFVYGVSETLH